MKNLTVKEIEYIAHYLAKKLFTGDEPIPDFQTRYPNILESCLATPFATFAGKNLYGGFLPKAALLFYLMIKNHPFKNGNKRIAVTTLLYFLHKNGKWIVVDTVELYQFARWIAESNPKVKDATVQAIHDFLRRYLVPAK